jgi:hypothetical protein
VSLSRTAPADFKRRNRLPTCVRQSDATIGRDRRPEPVKITSRPTHKLGSNLHSFSLRRNHTFPHRGFLLWRLSDDGTRCKWKYPDGRSRLLLMGASALPPRCPTVSGGMIMKLPRRNFLRSAAGGATLHLLSCVAVAQSYPSRRVTMTVPFPAGGATDAIGRIVAEDARIDGATDHHRAHRRS